MKLRPGQIRTLSTTEPRPLLVVSPRDPDAPKPIEVTTPDELAEVMGWLPLTDERREEIRRAYFPPSSTTFVQLTQDPKGIHPADRTPPTALVELTSKHPGPPNPKPWPEWDGGSGNPIDDIRELAEEMRKSSPPSVFVCVRCLGPVSNFRMTDDGPVHWWCPGERKP